MTTTNYSYTNNYNFAIPRYDTRLWHGAMKNNLTLLDTLIAALGLPAVTGIWQNATAYVVGDRVFDVTNSIVYECKVAHTSASTGTFEADRTANPTYWSAISNLTTWRGVWASSTSYFVRDIVRVDYIYYQCTTAHTSSASFASDSANWEVIADFSVAVTAAETAQTAAETAQTAAETAQTAAELAETNAETAETNAASSASAASTSATNAATSETNAATSASNAATSETNAANSASAAATSETNAGTSETNAASSASDAANSATDAQTAQTAAETAYDNFDDRYLGEKASDPSLDNDGDALATGALYWNTTSNVMKAWSGSAWVVITAVAAANVSFAPAGTIAATNVQAAIEEVDGDRSALETIVGSVAILQHQQADGVQGGTATTGAWQLYPINTEVADPQGIVSLSSNQFTVTEDCICDFAATFYQVHGAQLRVYCVTDSVAVGYSINARSAPADNVMDTAYGTALLESGKTYQIEYNVVVTKTGSGLGTTTSAGDGEVYGQVTLRAI